MRSQQDATLFELGRHAVIRVSFQVPCNNCWWTITSVMAIFYQHLIHAKLKHRFRKFRRKPKADKAAERLFDPLSVWKECERLSKYLNPVDEDKGADTYNSYTLGWILAQSMWLPAKLLFISCRLSKGAAGFHAVRANWRFWKCVAALWLTPAHKQ